MARRNIFKGTIEIIAGFRPKNDKDIPLMDAHYIVADDDGTRLDDKLESIGSGGSKVVIDATLSNSGEAADAKAVGDRITQTLGDIHSVLERI